MRKGRGGLLFSSLWIVVRWSDKLHVVIKASGEVLVKDQQDLYVAIVQLARLALAASGPQTTPLVRRMARLYRDSRPDLAAALISLLRADPLRSTRSAGTPLSQPVDDGSRLPLIRVEDPVVLGFDPILPPSLLAILEQIVEEHRDPGRLLDAGLSPTRTTLFVGPPGVGKTLAARWLARSLELPLIVLDLASVMSSLLGRTGENVRRVLDYAKQTRCVLLLDELDAVAKRRDDATEIGELKRLVTVLLQEIDMWPEGSLLLAATNHADLLDPAVWRRFDVLVEFPLPDHANLERAMHEYLDDESFAPATISYLATAYSGASFNDTERAVMRARRTAAVRDLPLEEALITVTKDRFRRMPTPDRVRIALELLEHPEVSQRMAHEITGVSRDTLRHRVGDRSDHRDRDLA